jgi:Pvc16 N-terminal domain/Carboxypeptidase regulatory-like domain
MSLVLDAVDATLHELFLRRVQILRLPTPPGTLSRAQVSFQPPDRDWRTAVSRLGTKRALNAYLVDIRENRRLRSNERVRRVDSGLVHDDPLPMRLDCHYLLSAWSPATDLSERAVQEHELLSEVAAVLAGLPALVPRRVFTPGGLPSGFPDPLADEALPLSLAPPEGFAKLAEFWGTMAGQTRPWKPVLYVVVTVPIVLEQTLAGAEVTTLTTEYRQNGGNGAEVLVQIAGVVRDRALTPAEPVAGAWVRLEDAAGDEIAATRTNERGEFTFGDLVPGPYRLRARAPGRSSPPAQTVSVPSPSGRYDLEFQ